jgi:holo-ACP synthase/triphosphoribosyl-dephospho-CoA synthase
VEAAANRVMVQWLRGDTAERVTSLALRALSGELAVTPKPGLVDRNNNGAHRDMHFFTFIDSIAAILPFFRHCAHYGFDHRDAEPGDLLSALRLDGKIAEAAMHDATGGVNAHQGAIFSLGLLSVAYGRLFRHTDAVTVEALCDLCAAMVTDEGAMGAVNEAAAGFPTVRQYGLPVLQQALAAGHSKNDAGVAALLAMLAHADDTNMTRRGGRAALDAIHADLQAFFASTPAVSVTLEKAAALDREFISRNISPGGTADLLAVTFFLNEMNKTI